MKKAFAWFLILTISFINLGTVSRAEENNENNVFHHLEEMIQYMNDNPIECSKEDLAEGSYTKCYELITENGEIATSKLTVTYQENEANGLRAYHSGTVSAETIGGIYTINWSYSEGIFGGFSWTVKVQKTGTYLIQGYDTSFYMSTLPGFSIANQSSYFVNGGPAQTITANAQYIIMGPAIPVPAGWVLNSQFTISDNAVAFQFWY